LGGKSPHYQQYKDIEPGRGFDLLFAVAYDMEGRVPFGGRWNHEESSTPPDLGQRGYACRTPVWLLLVRAMAEAFPFERVSEVASAGRRIVEAMRLLQEDEYYVGSPLRKSFSCTTKLEESFLLMFNTSIQELASHLEGLKALG
jgi:hypothetical protein